MDGGQHYDAETIEYDKERSKYLESLGNRVIRFTNTDVDCHFNSVCEKIDMIIKEKSGGFIDRGWWSPSQSATLTAPPEGEPTC